MSRRQDEYPLDAKVQQIVVRSPHVLFLPHTLSATLRTGWNFLLKHGRGY
jgi:hypothetical protein